MTARDQLRAECTAALASGNVQAFLRVIRAGETSQGDEAYFTQVYGAQLTHLDDHPRQVVRGRIGGKSVPSSAAGAYQFLRGTWDECAAALGLSDFSRGSQDLAAVFLIRRRKALADVMAGRFDDAVRKCAREWASLPGSPYGQPVKTMAQARTVYEQFGGVYQAAANAPALAAASATSPTEPAPPAQEPTMPLPAFVAAALPSIVQMIPMLGQMFGSGSEVAERNVKAAELVATIVQESTGARNAQEAVEILQADPAAVAVATEAVRARWHDLTEAGGGGIDGAGKRDAAFRASGGTVWQSPSFWFLVLAMPLVWAVVGSVVGLWGIAWPEDVRAAIATAVVSLVVGGASGYYWGQTTSRNRTPAP